MIESYYLVCYDHCSDNGAKYAVHPTQNDSKRGQRNSLYFEYTSNNHIKENSYCESSIQMKRLQRL